MADVFTPELSFGTYSVGIMTPTTGLPYRTIQSGGLLNNGLSNLVVFPQDFSNINWSALDEVVTVNTTIAPGGSLTADTITPDAVNATHCMAQNVVVAGGTFTFSFFAKPNGYPRFGVRIFDGATYGIRCTWDISNGTLVLLEAGAQTITSCGNGFYFVTCTGTLAAGTSTINVETLPGTATVQGAFIGDTVSGGIFWQAQLVAGSTPGPYYFI